MTQTNNVLDISDLPEHLKKELLDYYEFLTVKYQKKLMREQVDQRAKRFRKFISDPAIMTHYQPCSRDLLHERR